MYNKMKLGICIYICFVDNTRKSLHILCNKNLFQSKLNISKLTLLLAYTINPFGVCQMKVGRKHYIFFVSLSHLMVQAFRLQIAHCLENYIARKLNTTNLYTKWFSDEVGIILIGTCQWVYSIEISSDIISGILNLLRCEHYLNFFLHKLVGLLQDISIQVRAKITVCPLILMKT